MIEKPARVEDIDLIYPVKLKWRKVFEEFFIRNNIYLRHPFEIQGVYGENSTISIFKTIEAEPHSSMPPNSFCEIGAYSYSMSSLPQGTVIGRYCSLAREISIMGARHPIDWVSTNPISYDKRFEHIAKEVFGVEYRCLPYVEHPYPPPVIENDVWIGQHVIIKPGISIGNGAVIAAGAVVTKDVIPYSVIGGSPARLIKMRFNEKLCSRLTESRWWIYNYCDLPKCWNNPERFLDELLEMIAIGAIKEFAPNKIDIAKSLIYL